MSWTFEQADALGYDAYMKGFINSFAGINMPFAILQIDENNHIIESKSGLFIFSDSPTISLNEEMDEVTYALSCIRLHSHE